MWTRLSLGRRTCEWWTSAITGAILLFATLASGYDPGAGIVGGAECARAAMHAGHVTGHRLEVPPSTAAWEQPTSTRCPHCPSQQCLHMLPCAVTLTGALPSSDIGFDFPLTHVVRIRLDRAALQLSPHQPPTPPPQSVA